MRQEDNIFCSQLQNNHPSLLKDFWLFVLTPKSLTGGLSLQKPCSRNSWTQHLLPFPVLYTIPGLQTGCLPLPQGVTSQSLLLLVDQKLLDKKLFFFFFVLEFN